MVSESQRMQWFGVLVCTTNMDEIFLCFCKFANLSCVYFDSGSASEKRVLFGLLAEVVPGCREEMPFLI